MTRWMKMNRDPIRCKAISILLLAAAYLKAGEQGKPAANLTANLKRGVTSGRQRVLGARLLKMYYYHDDPRGLESLRARAQEITVLAPQSFWVDGDGIVHGAVPPAVLKIARAARLPIMPLVANPGFDRTTINALLHHRRARERMVTYLAYLAMRDNYVGFQIDFENINPADKKLFARLIERAAARLHRDGRLLSVAVVPRFSDGYPGHGKSGEFSTGEWGAAYDYRALGRAADFLTLMTYDHHGRLSPPGPIAGHAWVEEALGYAALRLTPRKIVLGIPLYGREWLETPHGTEARSLTFTEATGLLGQVGIQAQWDDRWRSPWFQYGDGFARHTVWFENSRSLGEKLTLVRKYRLRGFAAWRLGAEDPQFWALAGAATAAGNPAHVRRAENSAKRPTRRVSPTPSR